MTGQDRGSRPALALDQGCRRLRLELLSADELVQREQRDLEHPAGSRERRSRLSRAQCPRAASVSTSVPRSPRARSMRDRISISVATANDDGVLFWSREGTTAAPPRPDGYGTPTITPDPTPTPDADVTELATPTPKATATRPPTPTPTSDSDTDGHAFLNSNAVTDRLRQSTARPHRACSISTAAALITAWACRSTARWAGRRPARRTTRSWAITTATRPLGTISPNTIVRVLLARRMSQQPPPRAHHCPRRRVAEPAFVDGSGKQRVFPADSTSSWSTACRAGRPTYMTPLRPARHSCVDVTSSPLTPRRCSR